MVALEILALEILVRIQARQLIKMKKKFLNKEEFKKTFKPGEKLSFRISSPFDAITDPKGIIFFTVHYNQTTLKVCDPTGTAYICREGDIKNPFKFDVLSVRPGNKIVHVQEREIAYHHAKIIPSFIAKQAPDWVNSKTQAVIKKT